MCHDNDKAPCSSSLKDLLRKLFTDHAVYTKMYMNAVLDGESNIQQLQTRLLSNQDEIGTNVGSIIGYNKGRNLALLLREHIQAAGNAIVAAKSGKDLAPYKDAIFKNSTQVAVFLNKLNPTDLPYKTVKRHFDRHNKYVLEICMLHINSEFSKEISTYDAYYNHMLMFSDMLYVALSGQSTKIPIAIILLIIVVILFITYLYNKRNNKE